MADATQPAEPTVLDTALAYAALGWRVLPIAPDGKTPWLEAWQRAATTDTDTIRNWWTGLYRGHGIALAAGPDSGFFVIDMDIANGKIGDETLAGLEDDHTPLPPTVEAITGTGGRHLIFRYPTDGTEIRNDQSGKIGKDLDVRGAGGYIVTAPSGHPYKACNWCSAGGCPQLPYTWKPGRSPWEHEVAEAPRWLVELAAGQPEPPPLSKAIESPRTSIDLTDDDSPAEWFNATTTWPQLLEPDGWTLAKRMGSGEERWVRPGKNTREGPSATVGHGGNDALKVFTSSVPELDADRAYSRFGYEAAMRWAGDRSAMARHIRTQLMPARTREHDDLSWIVEGTLDRGSSPSDEGTKPAPPALNLPAELWEARPYLQHIRRAAHSRNRSADAVLHTVLSRVASQLPHNLDIPPIVGGRGSLNYYAALIGPSGAGKSTSVRIATELTPPRTDLDISDGLPPGSGEGVAELYMGEVEVDDPAGKNKKKTIHAQVLYNVWLYADEGETLLDMRNRQGATIMGALRQGWTGTTLGQANASKERKRIIPDGMYRLGFAIGFQPAKASGLLDDHVGGTPQRFIWANANDPTIPDDQPDWPGPLNWRPPSPKDMAARTAMDAGIRRAQVGVHPDIVTEIVIADRARARGQQVDDDLDSHAPLHRLKIASLLAILDGRLDINLEDWDLSRQIWATSCAVRATIVDVARKDATDRKRAAIDLHADKEEAAAARRDGAHDRVARYATRIARWVYDNPKAGEGPWTAAQLSNRLAGDERRLAPDAITHAVARGWLAEADTEGTYDQFIRGDSRPM